jgi:hypothetical protein
MYVHCKKRWAIFPSPAGMSLTKLFLAGKNLINANLFFTVYHCIRIYKLFFHFSTIHNLLNWLETRDLD